VVWVKLNWQLNMPIVSLADEYPYGVIWLQCGSGHRWRELIEIAENSALESHHSPDSHSNKIQICANSESEKCIQIAYSSLSNLGRIGQQSKPTFPEPEARITHYSSNEPIRSCVDFYSQFLSCLLNRATNPRELHHSEKPPTRPANDERKKSGCEISPHSV
jgi:hypothetical protein